jgi:hypothetical protein
MGLGRRNAETVIFCTGTELPWATTCRCGLRIGKLSKAASLVVLYGGAKLLKKK